MVSGAQAVTTFLSGHSLVSGDLLRAGRSNVDAAAVPQKLVLGFLATNGPSRVVDVLQSISAESRETSLSSIALALEDLVHAGTVELRADASGNGIARPDAINHRDVLDLAGHDIVSVTGDTRDITS